MTWAKVVILLGRDKSFTSLVNIIFSMYHDLTLLPLRALDDYEKLAKSLDYSVIIFEF